MQKPAGEMSLIDHFKEFRTRIIFSLLVFFLSFFACYCFAAEIFQFLLEPLRDVSVGQTGGFQRRVIFTSPGEAFFTYLRLSFCCSLFISLPFFLVQIYLFLAPGLYKNERKTVFLLFFSTIFLFFLGGVFSFYLVLPSTLKFFLSFENLASNHDFLLPISLETKISDYLSFVQSLCFGFGAAFILPVILLMVIKAGLISAEALRRKRRYVIVVIFIIAAVLTPPDVISQVCLAAALMLLFELVILFAKK